MLYMKGFCRSGGDGQGRPHKEGRKSDIPAYRRCARHLHSSPQDRDRSGKGKVHTCAVARMAGAVFGKYGRDSVWQVWPKQGCLPLIGIIVPFQGAPLHPNIVFFSYRGIHSPYIFCFVGFRGSKILSLIHIFV